MTLKLLFINGLKILQYTRVGHLEYPLPMTPSTLLPLSKLEMLISLKCPDSVSPTFAYASNRDEALDIRT